MSSFRVAHDSTFPRRRIPKSCEGRFEGVLQGYQTHSVARTTQGWKLLLLLLPRLLLHRPLRGGKVTRKKFEELFQRFHEGRWTELLAESVANAQKAHQTSIRRRHPQRDDGRQRQFDRAVRLVHMDEFCCTAGFGEQMSRLEGWQR